MPTVAIASAYARKLVDAERLSAGTCIKTACAAVARKMKRPPNAIWSLLFRRPKDISHDLFKALNAAVERRVSREIEELQNELVAIREAGRSTAPEALEQMEADLKRMRAALRGGEQ